MNTASKNRVISNEVIIHAPISLVWFAWTISDRVSKWFAPESIVIPKEGGPFELYFEPGNTTGMNTKGCKIIRIVNEEELHFTWKGPDPFALIMNQENELTIVKVKFEKIAADTSKVIVEHSGFIEGEEWEEAFNWHKMAWTGVLQSLKSALEEGEGSLCCQPE